MLAKYNRTFVDTIKVNDVYDVYNYGHFYHYEIQVYKMSADGEIVLVLGEKFVHANDDHHFCKPTDVAITKSGEFYVSDG